MKPFWILFLFGIIVLPASAQPDVQRDFYSGAIPNRGNKVVFCVWPQSPNADLDRAIGSAIARLQLFKAEFFEVADSTSGTQEIFEQELFVNLMDNCDAAMGASLNWKPLPEWLTITDSYFEMSYVLVTSGSETASLDELPARSRVGSVMFTQADMDLARRLQIDNRSELVRVPYDTPTKILEAVEQGVLHAGIVPGHAVRTFTASKSGSNISITGLPPNLSTPESLGMLMLSRDDYLRLLVDQAIAVLKSDGSIDEIAQDLGYPYWSGAISESSPGY